MQMAGALRLFYSTPAEREEMPGWRTLQMKEETKGRKEVDSDGGGGGGTKKKGRKMKRPAGETKRWAERKEGLRKR